MTYTSMAALISSSTPLNSRPRSTASSAQTSGPETSMLDNSGMLPVVALEQTNDSVVSGSPGRSDERWICAKCAPWSLTPTRCQADNFVLTSLASWLKSLTLMESWSFGFLNL